MEDSVEGRTAFLQRHGLKQIMQTQFLATGSNGTILRNMSVAPLSFKKHLILIYSDVFAFSGETRTNILNTIKKCF